MKKQNMAEEVDIRWIEVSIRSHKPTVIDYNFSTPDPLTMMKNNQQRRIVTPKKKGVVRGVSNIIPSHSNNVKKEIQSGIMVIEKAFKCLLTREVFDGTYYAILMTQPSKEKKTMAYICYSTNPIEELYYHNNLMANNKTTSAAAPHWILDKVLGVFFCLEKAIHCTEKLAYKTRGAKSKRNRADLLSDKLNVNLYSDDIELDIPIKNYLATIAPPIYSSIYDCLSEK